MKRRQWLGWGCAQCAGLAGLAQAQTAGLAPAAPGYVDWRAPERFAAPDLASDEGGLWAMMDREERRLRRSPFRMTEPGLAQYLTELACKLGGSHCPDIRVYPIRAPYFNASMAPNGMMQVWRGLLLRMDNEAQLAAVLGHELGHYLQRHTVEQLRDIKSRAAFGQFMGREPGNAWLLHCRGEAYRQRGVYGDLALALTDLLAAAAVAGGPPTSHRSLGQMHKNQGRTDAARQAWARYLALAPDAPDAAMIQQALQEITP